MSHKNYGNVNTLVTKLSQTVGKSEDDGIDNVQFYVIVEFNMKNEQLVNEIPRMWPYKQSHQGREKMPCLQFIGRLISHQLTTSKRMLDW